MSTTAVSSRCRCRDASAGGRQTAGRLSHLRLQHLAGVQVPVLGHVLVHQLVRDADDVQPAAAAAGSM
jgi:hypothetical protein